MQPVGQGNAEWHQYLLSLSKAIAGNAEQMARVLGLVQATSATKTSSTSTTWTSWS